MAPVSLLSRIADAIEKIAERIDLFCARLEPTRFVCERIGAYDPKENRFLSSEERNERDEAARRAACLDLFPDEDLSTPAAWVRKGSALDAKSYIKMYAEFEVVFRTKLTYENRRCYVHRKVDGASRLEVATHEEWVHHGFGQITCGGNSRFYERFVPFDPRRCYPSATDPEIVSPCPEWV